MSEIRAIGDRNNNAQLMADCAALGYLPEPVLDATYELGRFWKDYRPTNLTTNDLDTAIVADHHHDFRAFPFDANQFATVVLDPPYKLNGTSTGNGPSAADARYGVGAYMPVAERHQMICDGIREAIRVASRYVLIKCMDQVNAGTVQWQTRLFTDTAEHAGAQLVDMLHVQGYRKQPEGRRQLHARRDYSTLLVCEVGA